MKIKMIALISLLLHSAATATNYPGRIAPLGWPGVTLNGNPCWGHSRAYGPYDYRKTTPENHNLVESYHFTPEVEALVRGKSASVGGDIDYTLRAFPNHPRALWAYVRLHLSRDRDEYQEQKRQQAQSGGAPPECYFNRALVAIPDDPIVSKIYGIYLHRVGELEEAMNQYQRAETGMEGDAELAYNMGLLYFELGDISEAKRYAMKAERLGYPLQGLQRKIGRQEGGG